jgi:hypothetical protein
VPCSRLGSPYSALAGGRGQREQPETLANAELLHLFNLRHHDRSGVLLAQIDCRFGWPQPKHSIPGRS